MVLGLPRFQLPFRKHGLLAALLALVGHLALGAVVLPDAPAQSQLAALEAASILCQTGDAGRGDRAPHSHRMADCALCPLGTALAQPAALLTPEALLPAPGHALPLRPGALPQARAPPVRAVAAAYPRGPPALA